MNILFRVQLILGIHLFLITSVFGQVLLDYPYARKTTDFDTYFGTKVEDPYRWLENMSSNETIDWLKQQQKVFDKYKTTLNEYQVVVAGLNQLASYQFRRIWTDGGQYFYKTNYAEEGVTIYKLNDANDQSEGIKLISSNSIRNDEGLRLSIRSTGISDDGNYMYLNCHIEGTDWLEIRIFDLKKKKLLPDVIKWCKFTYPHWYKNGFFYSKADSSMVSNDSSHTKSMLRLYYHRLGTLQKEDSDVITSNTKKNEPINYYISQLYNKIIIEQIQKIDTSEFRVVSSIPLDSLDFDKKIIPAYNFAKHFIIRPKSSDEDFEVLKIEENTVYVKTNYKSPTGKISICDTRAINRFSNFIPTFKETLKEVNYVWGKFLCTYYKSGKYHTIIFNKDAKQQAQYNFEIGEVVSGFSDVGKDSTTLFTVESLLYPPITFELDLKKMTLRSISKSYSYSNPEKFITTQIEYPANDGTIIPMVLIYKKNLQIKKQKYPVYLSSYGGFGVNISINYDPTKVMFLEMNGILAYPSIRGGGELGEAWHAGGKKHNRINSFNDFISAAEYLVKENYTDSSKIATYGASNGGLLTSACMLQRPKLFKAVISEVGVFDMIRYPKFTVGSFWLEEYGNPKDSLDFKALYAYSPYHNLKFNTDYPATLIVANEYDDRVPPLHSYKFLARLQEYSLKKNPHVLLFQKKMGHNGPSNYRDWIYSEAFKLCFIFKTLGIDPVNYIRNNLDYEK